MAIATEQRTPPRIRRAPQKSLWWPLAFYRSAIGKKYVMAITGVIGLLFILFHMLGNLKIYLGPATYNHYADWLRTVGEPLFPRTMLLWIARSVLIVALILHLHAAYSLTILNNRARPLKYQSKRDYIAADFASRTMRWSGIIVLAFLIFHLLDLTWGTANPNFVRGDTYYNVVYSFQRVPVAVAYVVANLALGLHIFHGAWSMFQSVGINNPRFNAARRWFAWALTAVIVIGNVSFPIMVQCKVLG